MGERVWAVRDGDGATVGAIVARAGGDGAAIADGRVFIGRRRVRGDGERVSVGDEVRIASLPTAAPVDILILADEDDLVAVAKPAGIPTIADHAGAAHALVAGTARALGIREAELHPTSRLDRDVSGVVIFARSPEAAQRLVRAREQGAYERRYLALAAGAPTPESGSWDAPIGRARDPRHRQAFGRDATPARSRFATVARAGGVALLALGPETGRTHQLRVHAAHGGVPLLGDRTYRGPSHVVLPTGRVLPLDRIMLHASRVTVPRASGEALVVVAELPPAMSELWLALGGDPSAWDRATSCPLRAP